MATTEIEKLERRYAENPQGLTFAPLAEVHRKNGDVARALELLRAGLELHPNYIPASIVLGRCHWDAGDLPAAESAFAHVLRLDDENVIALKSLADINERLERYGEAQRWLNRLLSIDRSNEDARQQLARVETAKQKSERKPTTPEPSAAEPDVTEPPKGVQSPAAAGATKSDTSDADQPSEPSPAQASEPVLDLTAALEEPSPMVPAKETTPAASASVTGSSTLEFLDTSASAEPVAPAPAEPTEAVPGLISAEFVPPKDSTYRLHPELTQDLVQRPDPVVENLEVETAEEVELQSSGASEFRVPNAAEDFLDSEPAPAAELEALLPPPPAAPPEPVPPQPSPSIPAPVESVQRKPEKRSYSARDTKGQSVAAFFATLLAARPAQGANGGPTPASSPAPLPSSSSDDVSFDEFFGAASAGSTPTTQGTTDPGKDDLDQFQSWLQNLKR
jgi:Tetratricopeptide repeat